MLITLISVIPYCHVGQILFINELFKQLTANLLWCNPLRLPGQQPWLLSSRKDSKYLGTEFCVFKNQTILLCGALAPRCCCEHHSRNLRDSRNTSKPDKIVKTKRLGQGFLKDLCWIFSMKLISNFILCNGLQRIAHGHWLGTRYFTKGLQQLQNCFKWHIFSLNIFSRLEGVNAWPYYMME